MQATSDIFYALWALKRTEFVIPYKYRNWLQIKYYIMTCENFPIIQNS